MDGILGIGITELVVIALITIIVAGPRTAMRWAYQAGQYVKQFQNWWQEATAELRNEVKQELRVLDETRQEVQADLNTATSSADPKALLGEATEDINESLQEVNEAVPSILQRGTLRPIQNRASTGKKPWLVYREDE